MRLFHSFADAPALCHCRPFHTPRKAQQKRSEEKPRKEEPGGKARYREPKGEEEGNKELTATRQRGTCTRACSHTWAGRGVGVCERKSRKKRKPKEQKLSVAAQGEPQFKEGNKRNEFRLRTYMRSQLYTMCPSVGREVIEKKQLDAANLETNHNLYPVDSPCACIRLHPSPPCL